MAEIFTRMRAMYQSNGGAFADPIVNLSWPYAHPNDPTPQELAREFSGKALKDLADPKDATKITRKAGEQLAGFAELRNDGSTSSGCWIFCGAWGPTGNLMARRDNSDPTGYRPDHQLGIRLACQSPRPLQPRILRCERQAIQSRAGTRLLERHRLGRRRHSGLQSSMRTPPTAWARSS
jgi:hypothetical protein